MEMKSDINELIKLRLLRKIPKSKAKGIESIKSAEIWIAEAENNLKNNALRSCILTAYLAMFHAARAVLFVDGFREKSHYIVARYLELQYVRKGLLEHRWIKLLDYYRETRHSDQYSTSFITTEEDAKKVLVFAKQFVDRIKQLLAIIEQQAN